ncbi:membrane-bound transcription factor site-1 protease [Achlya hypogyna]|uniref:subtilisin n=1 Tax=Achlya hypogyna TaxID=1202772 RepID=A0A1V9YNA3_ACHHY|nr:membrane-bound transcription factor site-1 protease [Achlya hypogyna]
MSWRRGWSVLGLLAACAIATDVCDIESPWLPVEYHQYIVSFDAYRSEADLGAILESALVAWDPSIQANVHRRAPAYPTDFLLWTLRSTVPRRGISLDRKRFGPPSSFLSSSLSTIVPDVKSVVRNRALHVGTLATPPSSHHTATAFATGPSLSSPTKHNLMQRGTTAINGIEHVRTLWARNITGRGVKIGVFDTGLAPTARSFFHHVADISNWTDEEELTDASGHGTFVAGAIGGAVAGCPGLAPDASIHIFRVFTSDNTVYTSWFLDALNYALFLELDVVNLSVGGPDFHDRPFVDKVREASAHGIVVVSAAGNAGPYYGLLTNPADQMDVIGVGGLTTDLLHIAPFSSRGLTTWEIDAGYGRVKPDVLALAENVHGPTPQGTCTALNGTSMAAPLVSGVVALLLSAMTPAQRATYGTPGFLKALLLQSASRLPSHPTGNSTLHNDWHHVYEQGAGRINLTRALDTMNALMTRPTPVLLPAAIDLTDCPYMWPHCRQAQYFGALPVVFNVTIVHPTAVASRFRSAPEWRPGQHGDLLRVETSGSDRPLYPFAGALGVHVSVMAPVMSPVVAHGWLRLALEDAASVDLELRIPLQPTPPKSKRVLWDQFRNLQYPSAYVPKDDVHGPDPFDNHGDHLHTNFADLWLALVDAGYAVEISTVDYTCLDLATYGAVIVVDPEEPWFVAEQAAVMLALRQHNTSLVVVGGWHNEAAMTALALWDTNTLSHWQPVVGGANVPAINALLAPFGIAFGTSIWSSFPLPKGRTDAVAVVSSSSLVRFPVGGHVYYTTLRNATLESSKTAVWESVPILGRYQVPRGGRIVVMGDASCMDGSSENHLMCLDTVVEMVEYAMTAAVPVSHAEHWVHLASNPLVATVQPVVKMPETELWKQSKVVGPRKAPGHCRPHAQIAA